MRNIQPIHSEPVTHPGEGVCETHPAFAVATVSRGHGTSRTLFQSDLQHNETITLRILTANRTRSMHRDRVHPLAQLVEVEMSLAQWGALVSAMGLGSGVPVTLRSRESERIIPDLPYQPRIAESLIETRQSVEHLLADIDATLAELEHAIEARSGVKEIRERLRNLRSKVDNAPANATFAVKSLKEAAETVTAQARADIEAQILAAQYTVGRDASIEPPMIPMGEVEA